MDWSIYKKGYIAYLMLERGLSENSIAAYEDDLDKYIEWTKLQRPDLSPSSTKYTDLTEYIYYLNQLGLGEKSQARILSGLKSFFKYLLIEDIITASPADLIEGPKLRRKIPDVLSYAALKRIA